MKLVVTKNRKEGSQIVFDFLYDQIKNNGVQSLGLATGSTPEGVYQLLAESDLDFSDKVSINLDEYQGLEDEHPQSYHYFMKEHLLQYKPFKESYVPDGTGSEEKVVKEYEDILEKHPINIQLLGIGVNGHIGFNEPGTPFDSRTHRVRLAEETIEANKRFFDNKEEVPKCAYTMGLGTIMEADQIVLMAFGEGKAEAIHKALEGPVTTEVPASILQRHNNLLVVVDEEAARDLSQETLKKYR